METTVIIPAKDESLTIRNIVKVFQEHPVTRGRVTVAIDCLTTDDTADQASEGGAVPLHFRDTAGKGQLVRGAIDYLAMAAMLTPRIILCDGDYTGLDLFHLDRLLETDHGMVIGVPDWPECDVPEHVITAWPHVSGFRCLPWTLIPPNAHGYLLETQINRAAVADRVPVGHVMMSGLKSPFRWPLTAERMAALQRDRAWGHAHGIL